MADLYEFYNTGDDDVTGLGGAIWRAQTFTPAASHTITSAKIKIYWGGATVGTLTVGIRAVDGSSHPTGADLCYGTMDGDTVTVDTAGAWYEFTFGAGSPLTATTQYGIVVRTASGGAGGNQILWRSDISSPSYTGGCREASSNSGSSWSSDTAQDLMFEDWGNPPSAGAISTSNSITFGTNF